MGAVTGGALKRDLEWAALRTPSFRALAAQAVTCPETAPPMPRATRQTVTYRNLGT